MALVQGWADTRGALHALGLAAVAAAAPVVAGQPRDRARAAGHDLADRDADRRRTSRRSTSPASSSRRTLGDFGFVLYRNGLVLALHGFACVAGFMAGSSLPQVAEGYSGVWRWIHDKAGPLAIGFVVAATLFSLCTQAWALGARGLDAVGAARHVARDAAARRSRCTRCRSCSRSSSRSPRGRSPARRKAWNELLAATFVTVAIAIPIILVSAAVETWVTPSVLRALAG